MFFNAILEDIASTLSTDICFLILLTLSKKKFTVKFFTVILNFAPKHYKVHTRNHHFNNRFRNWELFSDFKSFNSFNLELSFNNYFPVTQLSCWWGGNVENTSINDHFGAWWATSNFCFYSGLYVWNEKQDMLSWLLIPRRCVFTTHSYTI